MATFRFSIEFGTDDESITVADALAQVEVLREWLAHYPIRKFGTLFVSDVEINPTAVRYDHPVMVTQGGFGLLDPENVAKALFEVWGFRPHTDQIKPASSGVWLVPVPLSVINSKQWEWTTDSGIRVTVSA